MMLMPGGASSVRQGVESVVDAGARAYDPSQVNAFNVWHGSPHNFDRFSLDSIGTGEGAQVYGHGLYFAEEAEVAKSYLDAGRRTGYGNDIARSMLRAKDGDYERAARMIRAEIDQTGDLIDREDLQDLKDALYHLDRGQISGGSLYEASIDAEPEDFLDWDASGPEQSETVRRALTSIANSDPRLMEKFKESMARGDSGSIYESHLQGALGDVGLNQEEAAQALRAAGIPGIRYLDAGSRGAGEGSRNYVLFDDSLATILSKNGERTPAQEIARLLSEGRANEVTDELYAQADPQELHQLYTSGATGVDMPMDTPSRMARADEMGFSTDAGVYHATQSDFPSVDLRAAESGMSMGTGERAFWTTTDPKTAETYLPGAYVTEGLGGAPMGDGVERYFQPQSSIMPMLAKTDNVDLWQMGGGGYPQGGLSAEIEDAAKDGLDGVVFRNMRDPGIMGLGSGNRNNTSIATIEPSAIRSKFARFDPRLSHLSNLSAGVAGAGAVGLAAQSRQPEERRELPPLAPELAFMKDIYR
jgi:hypothetical protein